MLTFKRKLILNKAQAARIDGWMGVCRMVYNMCIEIRKEAYKNQQITVHRFALDAQLKEIREVDWVKDVPFESLSDSIKKMDLAYKNYFKGGGFPKWASKRKGSSISFRQLIRVDENTVRIPKIGYLKMFKDSAVTGNIKKVTIKKEVTGYFAYITTNAIKSIQCQDENQVLGIDMGITHFAVGSDGGYITNHRHLQTYERQLRVENRSLARKKNGGKNWIKQSRKISLIHNKIRNARKDYLHKYSTGIAEEYHTVFMEDLNIPGMVKNKRLSKHILDAGWGMFRQMLTYKTNVVAIDPKYTSQTCFYCGHKDAASRVSQAVFKCTNCANEINADHNAALTILSKGMALTRKRNAVA